MTGKTGVSILCTGDIHLGRHPGRVEPAARRLSPTHVWERIVDTAIGRGVDAVALTGDVVDQDNRYYEARGPLERGIIRLGEAGIPTFAVAGNHDFDVLPDLVADVGADNLHLLGADGRWEQHIIEREGEPVVRLVGWSFPSRHVNHCPVDDLTHRDDGVPTVGLLHCELNQPDSLYAPVRSTDLADTGVDAWLLGHIHRPHQPDSDTGLVLYPGSPQPLDPGEPGVHGPWLVTIGAGASPSAHQLPLATLRYRLLEVDLTDLDDESGFRRRVTGAVQRDLGEIADDAGDVERVVYRLRFTGRTELHRHIDELSQGLIDDLRPGVGGVDAHVDGVVRDTDPIIDLERLAGGNDPPGVLAKLLLQIRDGRDDEMAEESRQLFDAIRDRIQKVHHSGAFGPLQNDDMPDEQWLRRQVIREGMALLDEMIGGD